MRISGPRLIRLGILSLLRWLKTAIRDSMGPQLQPPVYPLFRGNRTSTPGHIVRLNCDMGRLATVGGSFRSSQVRRLRVGVSCPECTDSRVT
jgi:hypothetical protein